MPKKESATFAGFNYAVTELSAFTFSTAANLFTVSLKKGTVVHFTPADAKAFEKWLVSHKIRDIRKQE